MRGWQSFTSASTLPARCPAADAPTVDDMMATIAMRCANSPAPRSTLRACAPTASHSCSARDASERTAVRLAERCLTTMRGLTWQHDQVVLGAAIGIAFAEAGSDSDARVLLRQPRKPPSVRAAATTISYEIFDIDHHDALVERCGSSARLRDAFASGDLNCTTSRIRCRQEGWIAAEALLRWRNGDRLVVAAEFIDVAETSGLISRSAVGSCAAPALTRAVACDLEWWLPAVRVNVSARQFDDSALLEDVTAALRDSGLPPERLCLEITETTLMSNIDHALDTLQSSRRRAYRWRSTTSAPATHRWSTSSACGGCAEDRSQFRRGYSRQYRRPPRSWRRCSAWPNRSGSRWSPKAWSDRTGSMRCRRSAFGGCRAGLRETMDHASGCQWLAAPPG